MRVLLVNTSEQTGGAAIAANRLMKALNKRGVKTKMLVAHKQTDDINVAEAGKNWYKQWIFLLERAMLFARKHFKRENLFDIDDARFGIDITATPEFREADLIHINYINQGFMSLGSVRKILAAGKPVVWTLHDIWPATAICHVAQNCTRYTNNECGRCHLLESKSRKDYSTTVWRRKRKLYEGSNITFIGCSRWITRQAKKSRLLEGLSVVNIPNAIDNRRFSRANRSENPAEIAENKRRCREILGLPQDKKIILFVSQRATQERKGINYFVEAMQQFGQSAAENLAAENNPAKDNKSINNPAKDSAAPNVCVAILGGQAELMAQQLSVDAVPLGYIDNSDPKIVDVYNAADVFVTPSLCDNLPNTIMEAMSCGVPCVGFNVGGIPEMIDHQKNGYVAEFRNAADLTKGILWVLEHDDYKSLSDSAIKKVAHEYSEQTVAMKHIEVYLNSIMLANR